MATPISIRLPDELRDLIDRRASDENRSLNAQIITLLEAALGLRRASELPTGAKKTYKPDPRPERKRK